MSSEKIKVSLIHNVNRTIHEGELELIGDYPNCGLIFTSAVSRDIEVEGHDYFKCLTNLRIELEKQNYYLLCSGARRDISCGGMLRESSDGCLAYIIKLGEYCHLDEDVYIFDYAKPDFVVSVKEQEEFNKLHDSSLPEIVSYYGEFAETISSQNRENIRERLSAYLDCQFLQRKSILDFRQGERLSLKFLDTPDRPHWNIEVEIDNNSINVMLTVGNEAKQKAFLEFLNEQLVLNGVVCKLKQM